MFLAQNIRFLRKRAGLSQEELGNKIGKTYTVVGGYEKKKISPPIDVIMMLCEIFDVDVSLMINRDLAKGDIVQEPIAPYKAPDDGTLMRVVDRLERQLSYLEERIKEEDPELAKKLGVK